MTAVPDVVADARRTSFWLDDPGRPARRPSLAEDLECDLLVVGGGYSGLWTAVLAKEREPHRDVVLVESHSVGWAASGRNGGFCDASLTHGEANGRSRFPEEYDELDRLGRQNLAEIKATVDRYGIDCQWESPGQLVVATEQYQIAELRESCRDGAVLLDREAVRAELNSPTFLAGSWAPDTAALVNPARLAWGLADAAARLGVRIFETTAVTRLGRTGGRMVAHIVADTVAHRIVAGKIVLGTNVFSPLLRRVRPYLVPVYDYVLVTEPLTADQRSAIGWANRQGVADAGNQFHYYRLTADNRILWGGYDAIYHFGRRTDARYDQRDTTFALLARQFADTFPQLAGIRFSHRWGGAIDTCTRFCAFFGTGHRGDVAYAAGYTGLGVGATRFGAQVMLDLLSGERTERTRTSLVNSRPLPFPPEPLAYLGIQATRASLRRADARSGRRNLWLRTVDRAGLGFDS